MGWREVVSAELGIVIITDEDCLHCIELEAALQEEPLEVPNLWIEKGNGEDFFAQFPIFSASVDVLPFAGIFSHGAVKSVIRAATPERIAEALAEL